MDAKEDQKGAVMEQRGCQLHFNTEEEEKEAEEEAERPRGGEGHNFVHCKLLESSYLSLLASTYLSTIIYVWLDSCNSFESCYFRPAETQSGAAW